MEQKNQITLKIGHAEFQSDVEFFEIKKKYKYPSHTIRNLN